LIGTEADLHLPDLVVFFHARARAAWRGAVLTGRSFRVQGAVAWSAVSLDTADLAMGVALPGIP